MRAAESGAFSRGRWPDSENARTAERGLPKLGLRMDRLMVASAGILPHPRR